MASLSESETKRRHTRGHQKLDDDHVLQADKGCDLDFLVGASGSVVKRESYQEAGRGQPFVAVEHG